MRLLYRPQFTDVAQEYGIGAVPGYQGVSWSDFDGDGFLDLLIVGEKSTLYKNTGHGFVDVTTKSGIDFGPRKVESGVFGDFNGDGCGDLFLIRFDGPVSLYKNNCNGTFSDVTDIAGIKKEDFRGYGAAWGDYDHDGCLDLYVANHGTNSAADGWRGISQPNRFYHNNCDGTFSEVSQKTGVSGIANCPNLNMASNMRFDNNGIPNKMSFQPIWFDFNNDGLLDLFVATENNPSPLYKNDGDGTFTDVTEGAGLCRRASNMGVSVGDFNGDGNMDIYTTNVGANYLWKNNGNGRFTETAAEVKTADLFGVSWGTGFLDFDNDGNLDIYGVNGIVLEGLSGDFQVGKVKKDVLFKNNGDGTFTNVASQVGILDDQAKEAVAFADFDNDGFVDIAVISSGRERSGRVWLYKNSGNRNHFLTIQLKGVKSNREGIGARIIVSSKGKSQIRDVSSGSSYISQSSLWQTFGLGQADAVDKITIKWPSGITQTLANVRAGRKIVVEEK